MIESKSGKINKCLAVTIGEFGIYGLLVPTKF